MGTTPEGKVKDAVKKVLDAYKPHVYYRMAVLNGMGRPGLDFYGCAFGYHFEIETKADHKELTPRQKTTTGEIEAAWGKVFAICSRDAYEFDALKMWLAALDAQRRRESK